MEKLVIEATESTPFIYFNPDTNILLIKGNSYPGNRFEFYHPVYDWICRYLEQLTEVAVFNLELQFLNTGSSRFFMSLFEMMDKEYLNNKNIVVNWCYHSDNEMGRVYYDYFKENLSMPFNIIENTKSENILWKEKERLFEDDVQFLNKITGKCKKEIPRTHPLHSDLQKLILDYEKNLKETRRMIQISDLLEKNLKETNNKLTLANELKSQLIALALHDLRNPLSIISTGIEYLESQLPLTPAQKELFCAMEKAASRMLNLIVEILENKGIDLESIKLKPEKFSVSDTINEVIAQNTFFQEKKKQELTFTYDTNTHYIVFTDKILFKEIIDNLVSNAIKYSPYGKHIKIKLEKINTQKGEYWIKTSIQDEGPGLSKNELGMLFKKNRRLSTKPTGDETSTGIGLYLSKKFSVLLKGKLKVESESGKGCVFSFEIPEASKDT